MHGCIFTHKLETLTGTSRAGVTILVRQYICILLTAPKCQHLHRILLSRYSVYLLYWYKSTNTDAGGEWERVHFGMLLCQAATKVEVQVVLRQVLLLHPLSLPTNPTSAGLSLSLSPVSPTLSPSPSPSSSPFPSPSHSPFPSRSGSHSRSPRPRSLGGGLYCACKF